MYVTSTSYSSSFYIQNTKNYTYNSADYQKQFVGSERHKMHQQLNKVNMMLPKNRRTQRTSQCTILSSTPCLPSIPAQSRMTRVQAQWPIVWNRCTACSSDLKCLSVANLLFHIFLGYPVSLLVSWPVWWFVVHQFTFVTIMMLRTSVEDAGASISWILLSLVSSCAYLSVTAPTLMLWLLTLIKPDSKQTLTAWTRHAFPQSVYPFHGSSVVSLYAHLRATEWHGSVVDIVHWNLQVLFESWVDPLSQNLCIVHTREIDHCIPGRNCHFDTTDRTLW